MAGELDEELTAFLNERFAGKDLSQAQAVLDAIQADRDRLLAEASRQHAQGEALQHAAVQALDHATATASQAQGACRDIADRCKKGLADEGAGSELLVAADRVDEMQRAQTYLRWMQRLDLLCEELENAVEVSTGTAVGPYMELLKLHSNLESSSCSNLKRAVQVAVEHWFGRLSTTLITQMNDVLDALQWPNTMQRRPPNYGSSVARFQQLFAVLLDLRSPYSDDRPETTVGEGRGIVLSVVPLQLMLDPVRKRLRYHFSGRRETNRIDKPEWMFTYVLRQLKDHVPFLTKYAQPLLDARDIMMDVQVAFAHGLVQAVNQRLEADMEAYARTRELLSHVITEALAFENDLRELYGYPARLAGCVHLFVDVKERFQKWVEFETDYAVEQYQSVLHQADAFEARHSAVIELDPSNDLDTLRPTVAADAIALLLQAVTERIQALDSPQQQYEFVKRIQLRLLQNFLVDVAGEVKQHHVHIDTAKGLGAYCRLINSLNYLHTVTTDWADQLLFVQMQAALTNGITSSDEHSNDGVFDAMLTSYEHQCSTMLARLVDQVLDSLRQHIDPYRKQKWMVPTFGHTPSVVDPSPALCMLLAQLKATLTALRRDLAQTLFLSVWPRIAQGLSRLLYDQLVLANHFNQGGAAQLDYDMALLYSVFSLYSARPENYFKEMKDCVRLLRLGNDAMANLRKTLAAAAKHLDDTHEDYIKAQESLQTIGVFCLAVMEAHQVLDRFIPYSGR
eukprot:comp20593_c0_seq1/m.26529 comp20593_c0_seq1/g.26529  ORF comp20593_c0_seq1/g.26529 comp20593_c0_seq1/m.26529 type:complete len:738 (-) comp20593_c0_seq1:131-2344(-)